MANMTRDEFGRAYEEGFRQTVLFLMRTGIEEDVATDAAQCGWLRGWEKREYFRGDSSILTWINRIAINEFRMQFRGRKGKAHHEDVDLDNLPSKANELNVHIDVELLFQVLLPHERRVFAECMSGKNYKVVAKNLGTTERGVKSFLHRTRILMLQRLEARTQVRLKRSLEP